MKYNNPNHPIIRGQSIYQIINFDSKRSKFNECFNLIMEHATGLFTPGSLLYEIKSKLKDTQFIEISYNELCSHLSIKSHKNFKNACQKLPKNYKIYILYFDPIKEIKYLHECPEKQIIYNEFIRNEFLPAARFAFKLKSIIVINSKVVKDENRLEQALDHELNHVFEPFLNDDNDSIDEDKISSKIELYIEKYLIDELGIKISSKEEFKDYAEHMFSRNEFYEMTADLCNVLSLYFDEKNSVKLFQKFENMLTESYINSNNFKQLEEPIKGSILFAYTCKRFLPKRWKIVLSKVKEQLNLNSLSGSVKLFINKIKENLKKFLY